MSGFSQAHRTRHRFSTLVWARNLVPLLLLALGCQAGSREKINVRGVPGTYIQGSFIVEFAKDQDAAKKEQNLTELDKLSHNLAENYDCHFDKPAKVSWETKSGKSVEDLDQIYHIHLKDCELDSAATKEILTKVADSEDVISVESESVATAIVAENDPNKGSQYYLTSIHRDQACDLAGKSETPIIVAVIDSGVEREHPDLVNSFYRNESGAIIGANFYGKGANLPPDDQWDDENGHGTHVAGIIAATSNNGEGITGVAACGNIKIMPVRVLGPNGKGSTILVDRGVQWAIDMGADIINMSLGSYQMYLDQRVSHQKSLYDYAANNGVTVFAAMGNDGHVNGTRNKELLLTLDETMDPAEAEKYYLYHFPSSYDNVIGVASTTNTDEFSGFSNRGPGTDIAAPGSQILSTYKGSYSTLSGTSMATPVAAASYAIALGSAKDKLGRNLSMSEIESPLTESVNAAGQLDALMVTSSGVIDAEKLTQSILRIVR
jgi:hypothetical protein